MKLLRNASEKADKESERSGLLVYDYLSTKINGNSVGRKCQIFVSFEEIVI